MDAASREDADIVLQVPPKGQSWVVLHARPRCEKKAVDFCRRNEIPSYLPLRRKVHQYGKRERTFLSPLFPGYVFCVASPQQQTLLKQNRYVANLLEVIEQVTLVEQLRQVEQALTVGDVMEVMPYLEAGKPVRVTGGPLKGVEGFVLRIKGKTKVVISVDMIQQSVAMEVDSSFLAPG